MTQENWGTGETIEEVVPVPAPAAGVVAATGPPTVPAPQAPTVTEDWGQSVNAKIFF